MAFSGSERPLYINIALYNRSSVARAGTEDFGMNREESGRPGLTMPAFWVGRSP